MSCPLCTLWMGMEISLVMNIFVKNTILFVRRIYVSLLKAVAGLVQLIKGALCYSPVIPRLGNLIISGINFTEQICNNKVLRTLVNTQIFPSKVKNRPIVFDFPEDKGVRNRTRFIFSTSTKGKRSSV